jgi:hypothetical protein
VEAGEIDIYFGIRIVFGGSLPEFGQPEFPACPAHPVQGAQSVSRERVIRLTMLCNSRLLRQYLLSHFH